MNRPLIYLACPFSSHANADLRQERFNAANRCAAALMSRGLVVFSPISHTAPIAEAGKLPLGWDYWESYDRAFLSCSMAVYVLTIDGWQESRGVQAELAIAREMGLPIRFVDVEGNEVEELTK